MIKLIKLQNNDLIVGEVIDIRAGTMLIRNVYLIVSSYDSDNKPLFELIDYTQLYSIPELAISWGSTVSIETPNLSVLNMYKERTASVKDYE